MHKPPLDLCSNSINPVINVFLYMHLENTEKVLPLEEHISRVTLKRKSGNYKAGIKDVGIKTLKRFGTPPL